MQNYSISVFHEGKMLFQKLAVGKAFAQKIGEKLWWSLRHADRLVIHPFNEPIDILIDGKLTIDLSKHENQSAFFEMNRNRRGEVSIIKKGW